MGRTIVACVFAAGAWLAGLPAALACGGFFCSNVPVDQSGEHLLFGIEEDGTVVAHIQIQYEGAAESFAWVLPLPTEPEVGVGSDEVFRLLRRATDPRFEVEWSQEGNCWSDPFWMSDPDGQIGFGGEGEGEGEVTVLQEGAVGPYERAVIQSGDAQVLLDWLSTNGYDIPELSLATIQSYVNDDYVFLALRLQKDRTVGELVPVTVRFAETAPCIPLRLTAIAARPDMPIYAWVLAEGRAVSTNFLDVEPNWAAVDWLHGGSNYEDVVRRAVDEATGLSFVTEHAERSSATLSGLFWTEGKYRVDELRDLLDPISFFAEVQAQGFAASPELLGLLRQFIPKPAELVDVDEQSFYNCLECYRDALVDLDFDAQGFADAIQEVIVVPLVEAQALADRHPYLTRLHTTISPAEMTEDPIFRFNLDLGDVSNIHQAQAVLMCNWSDNPVRLTLPDGRVLWIEDGDPVGSEATSLPASERALQMSESGPGEVVYDNAGEIGAAVDRLYGHRLRAVGGGGCRASGPPDRTRARSGWLPAAAMLALVIARRRR